MPQLKTLSPIREKKVNAAFRLSPFWARFEAAISSGAFEQARRIEGEFIRQLRLKRYSPLWEEEG